VLRAPTSHPWRGENATLQSEPIHAVAEQAARPNRVSDEEDVELVILLGDPIGVRTKDAERLMYQSR
jgi:hypothetical protein